MIVSRSNWEAPFILDFSCKSHPVLLVREGFFLSGYHGETARGLYISHNESPKRITTVGTLGIIICEKFGPM